MTRDQQLKAVQMLVALEALRDEARLAWNEGRLRDAAKLFAEVPRLRGGLPRAP